MRDITGQSRASIMFISFKPGALRWRIKVHGCSCKCYSSFEICCQSNCIAVCLYIALNLAIGIKNLLKSLCGFGVKE